MAEIQVVSFSEIDTFRQCPHKHQLGYRERWISPTTSLPLSRGTLWHAVLEQHYRAIQVAQDSGEGRPTAADLARVVKPLLFPQVGKQSENQELITWMYQGYVEVHGVDPQWQIVAVEHPAQFWLPTDRGGRSRFKLKIKIDLVIRARVPGDGRQGRLWLVDHKSGKDLPNRKLLEFDDQFGLYTWGLRTMGLQVHGQIHNAARTQRNKGPMELDTRFLRTPMHRADKELDVIAREAYATCMKMYGAKASSERNPDPDRCGWRCDFTEACLHGRKTTPKAERDYLRTAGYNQEFVRH